jgi:hypothetical protein
VIVLVELGLLALEGVLDHGRVERIAVLALEGEDGVDDHLERVLLELGDVRGDRRGGGHRALEVLVVDELVAVVDEQEGRRVLHAEADDALAVLLQLGDQRREVAVAGQQGERVDVMLGMGHVDGVDAHADVGRILPGGRALGDFDELDGGLVERGLVVAVAGPVGVGALHEDLALLEEALEDLLDLELLPRVLHAEGEVLEVDEDGDGRRGSVGAGGAHASS